MRRRKCSSAFTRVLMARQDISRHGLGLAIAQHIIEAHKGRIWLKSKPGKGSTFIFVLPIAGGHGSFAVPARTDRWRLRRRCNSDGSSNGNDDVMRMMWQRRWQWQQRRRWWWRRCREDPRSFTNRHTHMEDGPLSSFWFCSLFRVRQLVSKAVVPRLSRCHIPAQATMESGTTKVSRPKRRVSSRAAKATRNARSPCSIWLPLCLFQEPVLQSSEGNQLL